MRRLSRSLRFIVGKEVIDQSPKPFDPQISLPWSCPAHDMLKSARTAPKSWSDTLLLPKSSFPPRALLADRSKYLKRCTDDLYAWQREQRTRPTFTLHDGPPYANGSLHVGHALNKILKDILCRYKLSQGYRVDYVPGWDCHGLPTELKAIEQQKGFKSDSSRQELDAVSIRQAARDLATNAVEEQKKAFRGWGIMADWDNAWKTMDKGFELKQLNVFKGLVKNGLIYRRFRPVYWSPSSRTALAEAELEYREDHLSTAAYVKFPIQNFPVGDDGIEREVNAVIWTTTPWTLPANKAIGIHSDLDYVVVRSTSHGLLLIAASKIGDVQDIIRESVEVVSIMSGAHIIGATYTDPTFRNEARPILHADFVSSSSGSGLVHLAPGHGKDDYLLCLQHGIEAFAPLDDEGRFTSDASPEDPDLLLGKEVLGDGNRAVLDYLAERQSLLEIHKYKHKYPYDWRSKQPVIVRATEQWFANVGDIRGLALESLESVKFIPEGGEERLKSFVRNRTEWCISRQRAWGVPIPALYDKESGKAILTEESISHIVTVIEKRGIDAWWTDTEADPAWTPPSLRADDGQTAYIRGKDTMDVWFDSGTSWTQIAASAKSDGGPVADVYMEGSDQHRGWFQSSLLTRVAHEAPTHSDNCGQAPFKTLITHGFTLDQHSRKMSKSIGNVISPDEIIEGTLLPPIKRKNKKREETSTAEQQIFYDAMGPDALRLWVASCDYTNDVIVSQTILKAINGTLSKYRVTFKLLLGMLDGYKPPASKINYTELGPLHQIALIQLSDTWNRVLQHWELFEVNRAVQEINRYINTDLSALYVESIKDTIYADNPTSKDRAEAQLALFEIHTHLQNMLNPIVPLLVEESWDYTPDHIRSSCIHPAKRKTTMSGHHVPVGHNTPLRNDIGNLLQANAAVKSAQEIARANKRMGSSLQCQVMFQVTGSTPRNEEVHASLERHGSLLEKLLVVSKVGVCGISLPTSVTESAWSYRSDFQYAGLPVSAHVFAPLESKCIRCWKYNARPNDEFNEALCARCSEVVEGLRIEKPALFEEEEQHNSIATSAG